MEHKPRFQDVEFLSVHAAQARRFVEESAGHSFQEWIDSEVFTERSDPSFNLALESPLEAVFWIWWSALFPIQGWVGKHIELREQAEVVAAGERFRIDFSVELARHYQERITAAGLAWKPIAIELDGHTFHEKTREQVTYRNRRDRLLQQAGWQVFHLSFDEIQKHGVNAVWEVAQFAAAQFSAVNSALRSIRDVEEKVAQ